MSRRSSPRAEIDLTPAEPQPKPRALEICPACGSKWFHRCQVQQFSRERGTSCGRPDLIVLVCLCGTPRKPRLGGLAASAAFAREQQALVDSIDQALAQIKESNGSRRLAALAAAKLWPKARLDEFAAEVSKLEGEIGRRLARADKNRRFRRGRHWTMPERKPGKGMRDQLVLALQQRGFTFRVARRIVKCIFEEIIRTLRRGETVETSWGTFSVKAAPPEQERLRPHPRREFCWEPSRRQRLFRNRRRVRFKPKAD